MAITLRTVTGSALSHIQLDTNFSSLFYSESVSASVLNLHYTGSAAIGQPPSSVSINLPSSSKWSDIAGGGISRNSTVQITGSTGISGSVNIFGNLTQGFSGLQAYSFSHAEGYYTVASGSYQHVQGAYNISSSNAAAFIIGNGTSDTSRSNLIFASGSQVQVTGSLTVTAGVQVGNTSDAASATNIGTMRYRTSGNNSYAEMSMQTGASTYAWVTITQYSW